MSHDKSLVVHYNRTSECTIYPSYSFCNNYCVYIGGDADVLIATTAVSTSTRHATTVIGEDTDVLVLLCHHADTQTQKLYYRSEGRRNAKSRVWDIHSLQRALGSEVCRLLPFAHAIAGCDTTSRLFGIGKGVALRKLKTAPTFKQMAEAFSGKESRDDILSAGETALCTLYGAQAGEGLDALRYRRFYEKVSKSSTTVQLRSLPPTSAAASYHSARVYLQVQQWMGKGDGMDPEEWGWLRVRNRLEPIMTDLPPAPEALLKVVRCTCKHDCDTRRCSCKKHGLDCSVACGECKGISCTNSPMLPTEEFDDTH